MARCHGLGHVGPVQPRGQKARDVGVARAGGVDDGGRLGRHAVVRSRVAAKRVLRMGYVDAGGAQRHHDRAVREQLPAMLVQGHAIQRGDIVGTDALSQVASQQGGVCLVLPVKGERAGGAGDGRGDDTQTEVGGAVKFRISDTVLKHGNQMTGSPVFSTDDSRILPEVATGTLLTSNEIEGLELTAGRFTALSSQVSTDRDTFALKSANIVGASYSFTDNFSGAIHASDVEDHFKKQYINLNYNLPLADTQALNFDLNAYKTKDDGQELSGEVDNKIWSLAAAYSLGAHTFTLAHQRSSGDSAYAYGVDGGGTIWLANSVQFSDFDREDERSWQARYDLNMAEYGVPGLSFMTRYIYGDNINTGAGEEGKEHEFNFETKYVIQEGAAKDLSFRVRSSIWRANSVMNDEYSADVNDFRLIVEYPLSVL